MPVEDIYAALLGEPPTDEEKIARLAQQLRGQTDVGRIFAGTGDRVVGPLGTGMIKSAEDMGERVGREASTNRWRKSQEKMAADAIAARAEEAKLDRLWRSREEALNRANRLAIERDIKAEARKDKDRERAIMKTAAVYNKDQINALVTGAETANLLLQNYKDKPLPGVGRVEGFFPDVAIGTEAQMVRSTISSLGNMIMKSRSGAAVTDQELKRLLREMALGSFDEEVFRRRWPDILSLVEAEQNTALVNLPDDESKAEFFSRLGRDGPFRAWDPFSTDGPASSTSPKGAEADSGIPSFEEWLATQQGQK